MSRREAPVETGGRWGQPREPGAAAAKLCRGWQAFPHGAGPTGPRAGPAGLVSPEASPWPVDGRLLPVSSHDPPSLLTPGSTLPFIPPAILD